jgi:DNA-binding IclR family transcriptional regulator
MRRYQRRNQSIDRAFTILRDVATHQSGVGVSEVAARIGLPKSTVSRMLATLEHVGAVERLQTKDQFVIGQALMAMVSSAPFTRHLSVAARTVMLDLTERTNEAVALCFADGDYMLVADLIQTRRRVQVQDVAGQRFPLHATSPGKIFLAHRSPEALDDYLSRPLERYTPATITQPEALRRHLSEIREQGFAWTIEELDDIAGVSAPIRNGAGQVIAALNLYGPSFRFPPSGQKNALGRLIVETSQKISARLGEKSKA